MDEEGARKLVGVINLIESQHSESSARMADFYERMGVYGGIVDFMGVKSGQLWLDLCCRTPNLISKVRNASEPTVVGVDSHPSSLALAVRKLKEEGYRINVSDSYLMDVSGPPVSYRRTPKVQQGYRLNEGGINLILDDIRTLQVLNQYLAGKRADIITFTFCGMPPTSWFEGDYSLDSPDLLKYGEETIRRNREVYAAVRRAAFNQSALLLKPGGQLIYVDRMKVGDQETPLQAYEGAFGKLPLAHIETFKQRILQPLHLDSNLIMLVEPTGEIPKIIDVVFSRFEYKG